jgi:chaperonin GroES
MSNIKPLNGIIVLKKLEEEEQTYGQIVIPDLGKEKPEMGIVVETSDTYNWHRGDYYRSKVQVGDKVVIPKMGSMTISQDGEDYILIKETEILAIIENN